MNMPRQLTLACIDLSRAYDACGPDADAARERILQEADAVVGKMIQEYTEDLMCNQPIRLMGRFVSTQDH